jgi:hypothetical protein
MPALVALVALGGRPATVPGAGIRCQLLHNGGPVSDMQQLAWISAAADEQAVDRRAGGPGSMPRG